MSTTSLIHLIHSLSKAEKRQLKLLSKKQDGQKDYLLLFDLIDSEKIMDRTLLSKRFTEKFPRRSLENTSGYLFNIILDTLIQTRTKSYGYYELLYGLLKVHILNERNLNHDGYKELMRLKLIAGDIQNSTIEYILLRMELNYHLEKNFSKLNEKELVDLQTKARNSIRQIHNTQEHFALYELLKFRMTYTPLKLNMAHDDNLKDLLLNEMSVVNARIKHNLESQKLHLLFQSYFFTNTGNYKAASKTFHELNLLFEKNGMQLKNPPLDYFSALDGILDNLRTNGLFAQMGYYISKLAGIDKPQYPEYFQYLIRKTILSYELASSIGLNKINEAAQKVSKMEIAMWKQYQLVDEEIQNELLFYIALTAFLKRNFKHCQKFINEIILIGKINEQLLVYKAARLLNLILSYETRDLEFIDYDIRGYKRTYSAKGWLLNTEKLIFKAITADPDHNTNLKNDIKWKGLQPLISKIKGDRQEMQLLKYFDFIGWTKRKFRRE